MTVRKSTGSNGFKATGGCAQPESDPHVPVGNPRREGPQTACLSKKPSACRCHTLPFFLTFVNPVPESITHKGLSRKKGEILS